jgi:hypothetical protein
MGTRNRPSVKKREREQMKRQRERQKAEKAAQKRERRLQHGDQDSASPSPQGSDVPEVNPEGEIPSA